MATFFGEVLDVSSRAVWWSDSEDEIETEEPQKSINLTLEVCNENALGQCKSNCKRVFVTITKKKNPTNLLCVAKLKADTDDVAALYQVNQSQSWLVVQNKAISTNKSLLFDLVDSLFEQLLNSFISKFDVVILSKDFNNLEHIQYMTSSGETFLKQYLSQHPEIYRPLLAPQTFKNEFELALLEYCIVKSQSFVCLTLSQSVDNVADIPNEIINSVNELNGLLYSNLLI